MKRNHLPSIYQKLRSEFAARGFILCDKCSLTMRAGFCKGRHKHCTYYFCEIHTKPSITADDMDEAMIVLLRQLTPTDLLRMMFVEEVKRKWSDKYMSLIKQQEQVGTKIEELKQLKHKIAKKNIAGVYDDVFTKEQLQNVDLEITAVKTIISESKLAQIDIEITTSFMNSFLEDLGKIYLQEENLELKRLFIGSMFPKKLVYRNKKT